MEQVYLSQLLKNITVPKDDCIVSSVVVDSRKVEKNSIFLRARRCPDRRRDHHAHLLRRARFSVISAVNTADCYNA